MNRITSKERPIYITPIAGQRYRNQNGNTYVCLTPPIGTQPGRDMTAQFEREPDGWLLIAHGVSQYSDGSIVWDFSTEGHWPGGRPKNWTL